MRLTRLSAEVVRLVELRPEDGTRVPWRLGRGPLTDEMVAELMGPFESVLAEDGLALVADPVLFDGKVLGACRHLASGADMVEPAALSALPTAHARRAAELAGGVAPPGVAALMFCTYLERVLGDLVAQESAPGQRRPRMTKDILAAPALARALGRAGVLLLVGCLGPPTSLNLRNLLWHGFVPPTELDPRYAALLSHLLVWAAGHLRPPAPPLRSAGDFAEFEAALAEQQAESGLLPCGARPEVLERALPDDFRPAVRWALARPAGGAAGGGDSDLVLATVLPALEALLRDHAAGGQGAALARTTELYTTLDQLLADGSPAETVAPEAGLLVLRDTLLERTGPLLRHRLSHGEVSAEALPPVATQLTLLAVAAFADRRPWRWRPCFTHAGMLRRTCREFEARGLFVRPDHATPPAVHATFEPPFAAAGPPIEARSLVQLATRIDELARWARQVDQQAPTGPDWSSKCRIARAWFGPDLVRDLWARAVAREADEAPAEEHGADRRAPLERVQPRRAAAVAASVAVARAFGAALLEVAGEDCCLARVPLDVVRQVGECLHGASAALCKGRLHAFATALQSAMSELAATLELQLPAGACTK